MTRVSLHHLTKQFVPNRNAVEDLNLEIPSGKITALLGPSGCGKTTILKLIAGLLMPTAGDIRFDDVSVLALPTERRGAVMVFQSQLLFPYLSVGENVAFGLKMRGEARSEIRHKVAQMLEMVQMGGYEDRKPSQLSGGQQQRVALARALVVQPRLLLLDEPLSSLDAHLRDEMREFIRDLQRRQSITTLFVTHDQEEAMLLADQIALLLNGALQQVDKPRAFYESPANLAVARFFGAKNTLPGIVNGTVTQTAIGNFQVENNHLPTGSVTLAIRPENIRIQNDRCLCKNTFEGRVQSCLFTGRITRMKVLIKEFLFEVITEAGEAGTYHEGDRVRLSLPPDKLWVFPNE
jgi:ABC-type Fe3+/spermidine/putrescine transport system ATPase subunit